MTDRPEYLSDEQVDRYVQFRMDHPGTRTPRRYPPSDAHHLAREVQANRRLRATCSTCAGQTRYEGDGWTCPNPDCEDGRLTVEATIKLLVDALRQTREYIWDGDYTADDDALSVIDAVLASLPKDAD